MECCRHSVDSCDLVSGIGTYKRRELFTDIFKQVSDINSESVPIESKVSYTLPMEERKENPPFGSPVHCIRGTDCCTNINLAPQQAHSGKLTGN